MRQIYSWELDLKNPLSTFYGQYNKESSKKDIFSLI